MDKSKIMKASDFFKSEITPCVLGAFFRRAVFSDDNKYIFAYFSFRKGNDDKISTKEDMEKHYQDYCDNINSKSGLYPFWQVNDGSLSKISKKFNGVYLLLNDNEYTNNDEDTYKNFNKQLLLMLRRQHWVLNYKDTESRKDFLRGFFDIACSYDANNLVAVDYYVDKKTDTTKLMFFIENDILPLNYANFNSRLTSETKEKSDQFRISAKYYFKEIGTFSEYKISRVALKGKDFCLKKYYEKDNVFYFDVSYDKHTPEKQNKQVAKFIEMYHHFLNIGYGYRVEGNASEEDIQRYREEYGFEEKSEREQIHKRKEKLKNDVLTNEKDFCLCCGNKYDIKDRSFLQLRKEAGNIVERYYFEVHHAISLGSALTAEEQNALDVIENLGKLCPVCHRCLTGKSGKEEDIKELLKELLNNSPKIKSFAELYYNTDDMAELIEEMYETLR